MKVSEFKQLIREEVRKVLKEAIQGNRSDYIKIMDQANEFINKFSTSQLNSLRTKIRSLYKIDCDKTTDTFQSSDQYIAYAIYNKESGQVLYMNSGGRYTNTEPYTAESVKKICTALGIPIR